MLQIVPAILGSGFIGLSFLMLYLGYRAMQTVNRAADPDPNMFALCRFFLKISLTFLIVAAPLQFLFMYVQSRVQEQSVVLFIGVPTIPWESNFGDVTMSFRDKQDVSLIGNVVREEFSNEDRININIAAVLDFIKDMRYQLRAAAPADNDLRTHALDAGG